MTKYFYFSILSVCLWKCFAVPIGPRIPDGNSGLSPDVYEDSDVGFHSKEGVRKYMRVGKFPKEQTVENVEGRKLSVPGSKERLQESIDNMPEESFFKYLNRQILSVTGEEPEANKPGFILDNLEPALQMKLKRMTFEFQQTALAEKEKTKNDSERKALLQKFEEDIDEKITEIANEFENMEDVPKLVIVGDAIKRRMGLVLGNNVHYDKDSL